MKCTELDLPGVLLIEPVHIGDARGYFLETWHQNRYRGVGIREPFVQDNLSRSSRGVLRGLHYQHPEGQGKLVSVIEGEVFDVVADIRVGSPYFRRWTGCHLSGPCAQQLYIPEGFAHGFVVLSDAAIFSYKCTRFYAPASEGTVLWNDPDIAIEWPISTPVLSERDRTAPRLRDIPLDRLPEYPPAT